MTHDRARPPAGLSPPSPGGRGVEDATRLELDAIVAEFEAANARGEADVDAFLPDRHHPLYPDALQELLRVDLEFGWERGLPTPLDDYRRRYPELFADPARLADVAFEEYRLRLQAGQRPTPAEYASRLGIDTSGWFRPPDDRTPLPAVPVGPTQVLSSPPRERPARVYREPAEVVRELSASYPRAAEELSRALPHFPEPGARWCGFHLLGELGRGAFGRVYLARQGDLADRLVAVKVSPDLFRAEPQRLARLQHTHIVPVYSVHHRAPLVVVCMPYFGPATLADVLGKLRERGALPASGSELVGILRQVESERGAQDPDGADAALSAPHSPPLQEVQKRPYAEAVLWLGARLAEGLAHAHDRGILHRDLKPANVLLTGEAQPMLLDFNLAEDTRDLPASGVAQVGGTLPYMAPEGLDAFRENKGSGDPRADVYALGVILYELLTARHPFPVRAGPVSYVLPLMAADRRKAPPSARLGNPAVSPACDSIVRHCLEPDPARRYQSARDLAEDLRRQLDHLPLRHAPEPSRRERLRKWAFRHPRLSSSTTVGLLAGAVLTLLGLLYLIQRQQQHRLDARDALRQLEGDVQAVPFLLVDRDAERPQRQEGLDLCRRQAERFGVLDDPAWQEHGPARHLTGEERVRLRQEMGELLWWWARALAWEADGRPRAERDEALTEALHLNTLACACYAEAPGAIWRQRADLLARAGRESEAGEARRKATELPPRSPRERYLLLGDLSDQGRWRESLPLLRAAARHDAQSPALWLLWGHAHAHLGQLDQAKPCYDLAVSLDPESPWGWFHRGALQLRRAKYREAKADFDRVLELRPGLVEALMNRALAHLGRDDPNAAVADLTQALEEGAPYTRLYFMRARARARAGDPAGAKADFNEGLRREPADAQSWVARGVARLPHDPDGALADFDRALALDPRDLAALQNKAHVLAEHRRRPADAVAVLDDGVRHHPDFAPALAGRGVLLARQGKRGPAHADAKAALALDPGPANLYQVAGIYSLTAKTHPPDRKEAFRLLKEAFRRRTDLLDLADRDGDLNPLRNDPDFKKLVRAARELRDGP